MRIHHHRIATTHLHRPADSYADWPALEPIFKTHIFSADINYAMLTFKSLRQGLSVLIHPVQHDEMATHTDGARWLSQKIAA